MASYDTWDPRAYLRQYYATIGSDEQANARFARDMLGGWERRFATALEFGCGPTVHHAAMLAPYVDSLHVADYLDANLVEVQRWLREDPTAHDWDRYFAEMLAEEGAPHVEAAVAVRVARTREVIKATIRGDIRRAAPLGSTATYDLVASYYCVEAVAGDLATWARHLGNLTRLVAPGGALLLGAMRRCAGYRVFERTYPAVPVDEADFAATLLELGFASEHTAIRVVPATDLIEEGFDSICCVFARRGG
ncbi:MAG: guanitoxin biosynthesis pre-guanitoxin forming N-methyltransferase GntF [Planctomycetota bacterium]